MWDTLYNHNLDPTFLPVIRFLLDMEKKSQSYIRTSIPLSEYLSILNSVQKMERRSWLSDGTESHDKWGHTVSQRTYDGSIITGACLAYPPPSILSQAMLETQSWPSPVEWTEVAVYMEGIQMSKQGYENIRQIIFGSNFSSNFTFSNSILKSGNPKQYSNVY